jgi:hypothetical protein
MSNEGVLEKHYRVKELSEMWGFSVQVIRRLFKNEPGVLVLPGRRQALSIPGSVATAVHNRISKGSLQAQPAFTGPRRVILLSHNHRRMVKQPRNVLKAHARSQAPDSERVA